MRKLVTTCLSLAAAVSSIAQFRFDHLNVVDGLSQNSVNDILEDHEGYLWFATQDGLNQFDGYEFTKYMDDGDLAMSDNFLWSIVEDNYGNIWTASANGATRLNWKEGKSTHFFITYNEKFEGEKNQVARIFQMNGQIVISFASSGAFAIEPAAFSDSSAVLLSEKYLIDYDHLGLPKEPIFNAITTGKEKFFLFYEKIIGADSISFPPGYQLGIFSSELFPWRNGFFVGTDDGLLYYDIEGEAFSTISCITEPVFDLTWGPENEHIWIATGSGITLFDPRASSCVDRITSGDSDLDLSANIVSAFSMSTEGLYWVGTSNGGINIYDPQKDQFKFLTKKHGLTDKPVWSIYKNDSHLLVGAENGLFISTHRGSLTGGTFAGKQLLTTKKINHPHFSNKRITAIEESSANEFLIGTHAAELIRYNIATGSSELVKLEETKSHPHVVSGIQIVNAEIWVATHNGLYKFSEDLKNYDYYQYYENPEDFPTNYYLSTYTSRDSTLWFGTNLGFMTISVNGEITHFNYDAEDTLRSPAFNFISGFYEDKLGRMWISTFGGGVSRLDRKTGEFSHLGKGDGLAHDICSSILGNDESVFVGTNAGLSKINLDNYSITNYTSSNGLLSNEFAIAASFQSNEEFFFGAVNGIVAFSPSDLKDRISHSKPTVTGLSVNYSEQSLDKINGEKLDLYPVDKIFSFEFSNLSYKRSASEAYHYRMLGFDDQWVTTPSSNRRATYSLAPGEYEFQVKYIDQAAESGISSIFVVVHPAFYQTWWFAILVIVIGGVGIIALSRYYSHQQLKARLRKLELQQKIQIERERISRDLHDNVGSQITYIASSIDNISGNGSSDELRELGDFTRDTMRQLRETIWVINHDEVSLAELKGKVIDYLAEVLQPYAEIRQEVNFTDSNLLLVPSTAINIFRIIQEAVNNAVKHAKPKNITIDFELGESNRLTISDDGSGFDGQDKVGHFGLMNMRSRAQELGVNLEVESSPHKGTKLTLTGFKIGQMT